jgi:hypothetical protein
MSDYEREYETGGFEISQTASGWVVAGWSREQGTLTNWRHLVKPWPRVPHDAELGATWNDGYTVGEMISERARERPDKILSRGWLVE